MQWAECENRERVSEIGKDNMRANREGEQKKERQQNREREWRENQ